MAFFQQTRDEFASLFDQDYSGQWTNIEIGDLTATEQQIIKSFHDAAAPGTELQPEVLLVQAENEMLKEIYAASLRQGAEGALVVKLGGNIYPAEIQTSERKIGRRVIKEYIVTCGELFGSVEFADKDSEADVKIDNTLTKVSYTRCWVDFGAGGSDLWRVPVTLDLTKQPTKQNVLDGVADGTLASLLKPVAGGSRSEAKGMQELGEGMFRVIGLRTVATQNGDGWLIDIDGFGEVWSRGGAEKQLNNAEQLAKFQTALSNGTLSLKVANIQEKQTKDGKKVYLDSTFRIPSTASQVQVPVAAAAPSTQSQAESAIDYDAIPF